MSIGIDFDHVVGFVLAIVIMCWMTDYIRVNEIAGVVFMLVCFCIYFKLWWLNDFIVCCISQSMLYTVTS